MKYPIQVLFREYFEGILAAVFLALFLRFFVISILYVPTDNMEPNLKKGDFVVGWRLSYGFPLPLMRGERLNAKIPQTGDLISFRFPGDENQIIIRRVVGLPGDRVKIEEGRVFVNGAALVISDPTNQVIEGSSDQNYEYPIVFNSQVEFKEMQIPKDRLFVLADNRFRADDSRDWGLVPLKNVESEISFIWLSMDNSSSGLRILWDRMFQWVH